MYYSKSDFNTNPGDYVIHTYDTIHEYNHVREYNKVHEYNMYKVHEYNNIHEYDKIREYKYHEYKPTQAQKKKRKPIIERQPSNLVREPRKKKSNLTWPDKPIYIHTYRPYEYIPPPPLRDYEYKEYKLSKEDYMERKVGMYNGWIDYKLTPENHPPLRYLKAQRTSKLREDVHSEETVKRETSLKDIDLKETPKPLIIQEEDVVPGIVVMAPVASANPVKPTQSPSPIQDDAVTPVVSPVVAHVVPLDVTPVVSPDVKPVVSAAVTPVVSRVVSPEVTPVLPPVGTRTVPVAAVVTNISPVRTTSPEQSKRVYTPIGSRSPTPNLPPVGATVAGGVIAASVINQSQKTDNKDTVERQSPEKPSTPQRTRSTSISPDIIKDAVVGAAAGGIVAKSLSNTNQKEPTPQPSPQPSPTPQPSPSPKPSPQPSPPRRSPSVTSVVIAAAVVVGTVSEEETPKQRSAQPSPMKPSSPIKSPSPVVAPVPIAAESAAPANKPPQATVKSPVNKAKSVPQNPKEPTPSPKNGVIAAASLPTSSVQKSSAPKNTNNNQYQEEPSSWSPLPTNGSDKGLSLPPEVIATIEAYDKAHGMYIIT